MGGKKISIFYSENSSANFKVLSEVSFHDLGLDSILNELSDKESERMVIMKMMCKLTDDADVAAYRIGVFNDIINNPGMRERMMELLEKVGMKAQALKYPDQLSGGQKQRVAIARSVAMSPEIILLDEPTSALDPTMVGEVQKVIQALCRQGYTIVLVSHDMKFVEKVSDRVVFLDEGEVCEEGTPDQIFHNMKKEKTRAFIKQFKTFECRIDPDNADYVSFYTPLNNFTYVNNIEVSIRTKIIAIFEELCFQILIPKSRTEGSRFGIHFIVEYSETDHKASVRVTYTGVSASQDDEKYELPWTIVKHNCDSIEFDKESEDSETVLAIVGKEIDF